MKDTPEMRSMRCRVKRTTDSLGLPIDSGIRSLVTVLNLLGFKTCASCEGHVDHGVPGPWVHVDADEALGEETYLLDIETVYNRLKEILEGFPEHGDPIFRPKVNWMKHYVGGFWSEEHNDYLPLEDQKIRKVLGPLRIECEATKNRARCAAMDNTERAECLFRSQWEMRRFTRYLWAFYRHQTKSQ